MTNSTDHFSAQSKHYALARPKYPEVLFSFIASLCKEHNAAWDCATGNGQAAVSLAGYFRQVYATDFSKEQISNATHHPKVKYFVERVEDCSLPDASVDLITVATAAHWFNHAAFHAQVNRVLKPEGVLAVWGYGGSSISDLIDSVVNPFAFELLRDYWPVETKINWVDKYKTLPFPYDLMDTPSFSAKAEMNLEMLCNYFFSWSATQNYIKKHGTNPVDLIYADLKNRWGDAAQVKSITWELFMKCGRKPL
jgi:SAM-dependent methyltransferase